MILSLDPATHCGWCVGPVGAKPSSMHWGARDFSDKSNGAVLAKFRAWLQEMCFKNQVTFLIYEKPYVPVGAVKGPPMNPITLERLLGITGQIDAICYELRIRPHRVASVEFTKYLTGKGRFPGGRDEKKAQVIRACERYGFGCYGNDDAADAVAMWLYGEDIVAPDTADSRRRYVADVERSEKGIGGLFSPETMIAPRGQPRGDLVTTPAGEATTWKSNTT